MGKWQQNALRAEAFPITRSILVPARGTSCACECAAACNGDTPCNRCAVRCAVPYSSMCAHDRAAWKLRHLDPRQDVQRLLGKHQERSADCDVGNIGLVATVFLPIRNATWEAGSHQISGAWPIHAKGDSVPNRTETIICWTAYRKRLLASCSDAQKSIWMGVSRSALTARSISSACSSRLFLARLHWEEDRNVHAVCA